MVLDYSVLFSALHSACLIEVGLIRHWYNIIGIFCDIDKLYCDLSLFLTKLNFVNISFFKNLKQLKVAIDLV